MTNTPNLDVLAHSSRTRRSFRLPIPALALWLLGMVMGHHPILFSWFRRIQWDLGDTRFLAYTLEHGYRWVMRYPHHEHFWDPPVFYPAPNVAALSETLIGVGPTYWVWRWLGFPFDTAFQLWTLTMSTLNFATAYLFLRRCLKFEALPSALGAFFFAFAAARINQLGHEQLLGHFYTVLALYSLHRVLVPPPGQSLRRERMHLVLFGVWLALQLYAGVYYGWFLGLALGFATVASVALPKSRRLIFSALKRHWRWVPLAVGLAAVMLIPFYSHYGGAAAQVGYRNFAEVSYMQPRWGSWFDLGPYSWLYWKTAQSEFIRALPIEWEQRIGLGVLTLLLGVAGLVLERRRPLVQVMAVVTVCLIIISLALPSGATLWRLVYDYVPAAKAIRTVCRIGLLALIPISVGLAAIAARIKLSGVGLVLAGLVAMAVAEQGVTTPAFDKLLLREQLGQVAAKIAPDCEAFLLSPEGNSLPTWKYSLDAMWLQLMSGVPTVNGYSGNNPVGWPFEEMRVNSPADEQRIAALLNRWMQQNQWQPRKFCFVRTHVEDGADDGRFLGQDVPEQMKAGQQYQVSVSFKNTGTSVWTPPMNFLLGSVDQADSGSWGTNRIGIPQYVDQGSALTFVFTVRAPPTPGTYRFQWRMVHEWVNWFGEPSAPLMIQVQP